MYKIKNNFISCKKKSPAKRLDFSQIVLIFRERKKYDSRAIRVLVERIYLQY